MKAGSEIDGGSRASRSRWPAIALLALAACGDRAPTRPVAVTQNVAAPTRARQPAPAITLATGRQVASAVGQPSPAARDFKSFALNILLVPLLDDDLPTRWADPSLTVPCDDADVTIDGKRPDIGAPIPRDAFTVRWHMQRCNPLDGYFELSGDVELRVEPRPGGYAAIVRPIALQLISLYGVEAMDETFPARLAVGP